MNCWDVETFQGDRVKLEVLVCLGGIAGNHLSFRRVPDVFWFEQVWATPPGHVTTPLGGMPTPLGGTTRPRETWPRPPEAWSHPSGACCFI